MMCTSVRLLARLFLVVMCSLKMSSATLTRAGWATQVPSWPSFTSRSLSAFTCRCSAVCQGGTKLFCDHHSSWCSLSAFACRCNVACQGGPKLFVVVTFPHGAACRPLPAGAMQSVRAEQVSEPRVSLWAIGSVFHCRCRVQAGLLSDGCRVLTFRMLPGYLLALRCRAGVRSHR